MTDLLDEKPHRSWRDSVRAFLSPKVIALLFLGFSAGVPILLVFSTLSLWLSDAGVERATIGFFSWAALAYSFKVVWAPLIDKMPVPVLFHMMGRRRSWLLVAQIAIVAALTFIALHDPQEHLTWMAFGALALAFSSAGCRSPRIRATSAIESLARARCASASVIILSAVDFTSV